MHNKISEKIYIIKSSNSEKNNEKEKPKPKENEKPIEPGKRSIDDPKIRTR